MVFLVLVSIFLLHQILIVFGYLKRVQILTTTWRVLEVQEQDRTNYVITASEYNSGKYNHIENGIALPVRDVTNLDIPPAAPSNVSATEVIYENTGIARVKIVVSWTSTSDTHYIRYRLQNGNFCIKNC